MIFSPHDSPFILVFTADARFVGGSHPSCYFLERQIKRALNQNMTDYSSIRKYWLWRCINTIITVTFQQNTRKNYITKLNRKVAFATFIRNSTEIPATAANDEQMDLVGGMHSRHTGRCRSLCRTTRDTTRSEPRTCRHDNWHSDHRDQFSRTAPRRSSTRPICRRSRTLHTHVL